MSQTDENKAERKKVQKPEITVPERYDSPFMKLIAPFIATRYLWLAIEDINPLNFLGKPDPKKKPDFVPFKEPTVGEYASRNFAAFGMGSTFLAAMGWYSKNTLHDIKSLYAEAVGYELGKKTEDVTLNDIFMKSDNAALNVTRSTYIKRTLARGATAATFFIPWHKFRDFPEAAPKYDANANAGVGAIGAYLLGEGLLRECSFFDAEQAMVASAIHHNDANPNQSISSMDIKRLLLLQRKHLNSKYEWPEATSQQGRDQLALAERIASLMNQTYENDPKQEHAHFTIGKLNYLIGFGLLDKFPESMALVELANRSTDMREVKEAAQALRMGQNAQAVFAQFGIEVAPQVSPSSAALPPEMQAYKFSEKLMPKEALLPRSHQDFASQTTNAHQAI